MKGRHDTNQVHQNRAPARQRQQWLNKIQIPSEGIRVQNCFVFFLPDFQTRERRPSVEVLAGMVARTGREARTSKPDEQQQTDNAGRELTLLRAGCQRPSIQQLHGVGEIGLGKAVALAGGDSASDFDSGAALRARRRWRRRGRRRASFFTITAFARRSTMPSPRIPKIHNYY